VPNSELSARITAWIAWVFAVAAGAYWYATRDDEGLESIGSALGVAMLAGPAFLMGFATLVALVLRARMKDQPRVGVVTWVLCVPPALLGVWLVIGQLTRVL
jgi:hypothetical protein